MIGRAALALALLAAGCTAPAPDRPPVRFVPDAGGLSVSGSALRVDFGRAPEGVIPVLSRELGPPEALTLSGCPAPVVRRSGWGDLELTFTPRQFVGWRQGAASAGLVCG